MSTLVIIGALSASTVSSLLLYKLIRSRSWSSSVKVNCWFCNAFHVVPHGNRNCWDCPTCDQFNGFDETGDYIKPISAQYDEYLNGPSFTARATQPVLSTANNNGFCANCNRNQLLKITQLASFVPRFEDHFDDEVDAYRRHLESTYSLCVSCQAVLRRKLGAQDASLLSFVHSSRRHEGSKREEQLCRSSRKNHRTNWFSSLLNLPIRAQLLRLLSLTIVLLLLFAASSSSWSKQFSNEGEVNSLPLFWMAKFFAQLEFIQLIKHQQLLAVIGFFFLIVAIFVSGREKLRLIDAISSFMWLALLFSHVTSPVAAFLTDLGFDLQFVRCFFSLACLPVTLYGSICSRPPVNGCLSWRHCNRLNSSNDDGSISDVDSRSLSVVQNDFEGSGVNDYESASDVVQDGLITTTTGTKSRSTTAHDFHLPTVPRIDLDDGLQALKIGTPKKRPNSVSGIFTPRSYNNQQTSVSTVAHSDHLQNYEDFNQLLCRRRRWSVLLPESFNKSVPTHSSWVSGGYFSSCAKTRSFAMEARSTWFRPRIGAQSYSCPVSRAGSVLCDDRLSVISDPGGSGLTNRRGLLLSECKFNPFGSNSNTFGAASSLNRQKDTSNAVDGQLSLSSDDEDSEEEAEEENVVAMSMAKTTDQLSDNNAAPEVHHVSVNYLSGSWKRKALYPALVISFAFNALLLIHLLVGDVEFREYG